MKKNNLEEYYDFFLELLPSEYLVDIEIQDEYEKTNDYTVHGLSDEQVSQLAADSLKDADKSQNSSQQSSQTSKKPQD